MKFVTVKNFGIALGVKDVTVRQRILRNKIIKNEQKKHSLDPPNRNRHFELNHT